MRTTVFLVLACLFQAALAIEESYDNPEDDLKASESQPLDALATFLLAQRPQVDTPRSTMRRKPSTTRELIRLRGGIALGGDAVKAATWLTMIGLLSAANLVLSPEKAGEQYGLKFKEDPKENAFVEFMIESCGLALLSSSILTANMLNGVDVTRAIGYSQLPFALSSLKNINNKRAATVGMPEWTQKFFAALNGFFAWSFITGQSYSPWLTKVAAAWTGVNGIFSAFRPKFFGKSWGKKNMNTDEVSLMKFFGWGLAGMGALQGSLAQGTEVTKALGYYYAVLLAGAIDGNFVAKTVGKSGLKKGPQYAWMLLEALAVAKLLR